MIEHTNDLNNPAYFTTTVTLSNGYIIGAEKVSISDLIVPRDWKLAYGAIASDISATSSIDVTSLTTTIEYDVPLDSYVNCRLSAKEDDSASPIEVWLSSNNGQSSTSSLYCTLNNPGGFSGTEYFNNYNF